ncbi:MAG: thiamine pyrophosphate-dependent enzyme [Thermodesulfovibrionales bacterium]|nr:thiamine pyrophosphate-dependent enzyme [Thermodesulfovibrionales bacterium]
MKQVFSRPSCLKDVPFRYCPGCGHSISHRLVAECIDTLGIKERVIGIAPVGCAVFAYGYFDFDIVEAAHGRPPAVATGLKRVMPDRIVFSYQGDGDLASIGMAEIIHAAARGENITVIFINNATYGMTGGQMAPTTLIGQKTSTTPEGRDRLRHGSPIKVAEMLSILEGTTFVARGSLDSVGDIKKTRQYILTAFINQMENKGFSFVEILSPCPTDWGMSPGDARKWLKENMKNYFKTGILKQ